MTTQSGIEMEMPPFRRMRRTRRTAAIRRFVRESSVTADDLVYPLFVTYGAGIRREIPSMPGQSQLSLDMLAGEMDELTELGIPAVLLFGIPEHKDAHARRPTSRSNGPRPNSSSSPTTPTHRFGAET